MTSVLTLPSHMTGFLHELGNSPSGVFSYVSYPSAILPNRPKYRPQDRNVNIMHDKRVIRGNTYAIKPSVQLTEDPIYRQREIDKRNYLKKKVLPNINGKVQLTSLQSGSPRNYQPNSNSAVRSTVGRVRIRKRTLGGGGSSNLNDKKSTTIKDELNFKGKSSATIITPPVNGRKHCDIQTEVWLEEITDRVPEADIGIQTEHPDDDGALSRPPTPRIAFESPGIDKSTQILPDDPDLFVFDEEVVIVLEALVGKTLEQSLLEVLEEEEIAAITQQKLNFQTKKIVAINS